jgi:hypothetical protein
MLANQLMMRRIGLIVTAALFAVTACGGGGKGDSASTSSTSAATAAASNGSTTTTTTTVKPEDEVKAAYLAYWAMADRLLIAPDPEDPELLQRTTDPLLPFIKDELTQRKLQGTVLRTPPDRTSSHRIDLLTVNGSAASVIDCYVDARIMYSATGQVLDEAVVSKTAEATLASTGGAWKVSDLVFTTRTDGAARCAA